MNIVIGKNEHGVAFRLDANILADTRAIICASSGSGKSWLLRVIAEAVTSKIQTIIIDPEGEFSSLREKLDIMVVGDGGDVQASIQTAPLLAKKLAETGISSVIDIYEIPGKGDPWDKRRAFVSAFLGALMNLPKKAWHPMLVIVDEAHQFAPEKNQTETANLSRMAINSLMSAGRKRGIGGILATQRISKIHKDSIADAKNVFIGGTTLDVDQERAGDMLGIKRHEAISLRDLAPGEFYCYGPAFGARGVFRFHSAPVKTTHPKAGQRLETSVPNASDYIREIVSKFGDLPAEVQEEQNTLSKLQHENIELKRQFRERPIQTQPEVRVEKVMLPLITDEQVVALKKEIQVVVEGVIPAFGKLTAEMQRVLDQAKNASSNRVVSMPPPAKVMKEALYNSSNSDDNLPEGERKVLVAIRQHEEGVNREQLTVLTGYKRSTRDAYIKRLANKDLILIRGNTIYVSDVGIAVLGDKYTALPTGDALREYWLGRLPEGERKILDIACAFYPDQVAREHAGESTGYKRSTRDAYIKRLEAKKLITTGSAGLIRASENLFGG